MPTEDKIELKESVYYDKLGFPLSLMKKKRSILSVIFAIQLFINLNTSLYVNNITLLTDHFHVSALAARCSQMIFLIAYAFGSELWAPWSEELGRWSVLQTSLFFVKYLVTARGIGDRGLGREVKEKGGV